MNIDLDLKVKLFNEYLENGGIEKIVFPDLLKDLLRVKSLPNGKVNPRTVSSLVNAAMLAYISEHITAPFTSNRQLSEYRSLLQKEIFFDQETVETREHFDALLEKNRALTGFLFRGLNQARYRLYSSLQRTWISKQYVEKGVDFKAFLELMVQNARTNFGEILPRFIEISGLDPLNDLGILSFLQHHGCPTPLLDWTYSFSNALYFATETVAAPTTTREIDKYFCVYFIDEKALVKGALDDVIVQSLASGRAKFKEGLLKEIATKFTKEQIDSYWPDSRIDWFFLKTHGPGLITHLTKISNLTDADLLFFSDFKAESQLKYSLNNSMNIVNQKGAFTWNANPTLPLEHVANEIVKVSDPSMSYRFCNCININKNLAPYVREKLQSLGVTKDYIYPDPQKIARNAFAATEAQLIR
jgi:hypothetical protein